MARKDIVPVSKDDDVKKVYKAPNQFIASEEVRRINLPNDQWVDIKLSIPAADVMRMKVEDLDNFERSSQFLLKVISNWYIVDGQGNEIPWNPNAVVKLTLAGLIFLSQECFKAVGLDESEEEQKKESAV